MAESEKTLAQRWMDLLGEQVPSAAMFERMVGQCSYSADRFFTRLREARRPVLLAS